MIQPLGKAVCRFFRKLKIDLPYDPVIPLLDGREGLRILAEKYLNTMVITAFTMEGQTNLDVHQQVDK